jgi:hypothetical protein
MFICIGLAAMVLALAVWRAVQAFEVWLDIEADALEALIVDEEER